MKELLRTNNPTIIPYAKMLLKAQDIEAFEVDVHMSGMGFVPQRLMVRDKDHFMASAIMRDNNVPLES